MGPSILLFPEDEAVAICFASTIYQCCHPKQDFQKLGQCWWSNFQDHQKENGMFRMANNIARGRAICAKRQAADSYFNMSESTITTLGLREKCNKHATLFKFRNPRQIFNCDETGFQMDWNKHPTGTREHISVLGFLYTSREDVSPFIIYAKGYLGGSYRDIGVQNAVFGWMENGYIASQAFEKWFGHFVMYGPEDRPLILNFDGHKSHLTLPVTEAAQRENVVLFCLLPHCSHVLNPLMWCFSHP
ncbi:hypothetical protein N1851_026863 [Merluccius polli]|uniref:DDE-1 domain-containing protein n=1 Tax=Merluccius polli TaxID=89951 RepID=A0AA47NSN9_MERPO|nr:hypothetical protein N1851_026863 [Merluccius polli]